jgi:hypothetical protein
LSLVRPSTAACVRRPEADHQSVKHDPKTTSPVLGFLLHTLSSTNITEFLAHDRFHALKWLKTCAMACIKIGWVIGEHSGKFFIFHEIRWLISILLQKMKTAYYLLRKIFTSKLLQKRFKDIQNAAMRTAG